VHAQIVEEARVPMLHPLVASIVKKGSSTTKQETVAEVVRQENIMLQQVK
jgi:hypothetical protein